MSSRILIADDDTDIAGVLSSVLRAAGFDVDTATDGGRALSLYEVAWDESRPYHLIIADLAMPGMTGIELAERVRASGDITTKIVFLTAYVDPMTPARARVLNISGIWQKPLIGNDLCGRVRELLCAGGEDPLKAYGVTAVHHSHS